MKGSKNQKEGWKECLQEHGWSQDATEEKEFVVGVDWEDQKAL
jgi:hypothetical protein